MKIFLRNLKNSDIDILLKTENDESLWNYSIQDKPFSEAMLKNYIMNASIQNIFEAKQKRFVISSFKNNILGFIDLFDYEPSKNKAYVGIVVLDKYRKKGIGHDSIKLLELYCINDVGINKLCALIESNNIKSIKLFEKSGFVRKHNKIYEKEY
ncbi:MAG: GNAT family N-acetyltransferase [Flavobacteriaceae bacterium]|nr:GNAT family N-acetyltransferase [Flavobacteriaceae bacterium]